jgi:peptide/nickel transport system substrate-binding protein
MAVAMLAASCSSTPATPQANPTEPPKAAEATKPAEPTAEPTKAPEATAAQEATATTEAAEPTQAPEATKETAKPATYQEAPMLAEMVKSGKLPPVEERLPLEPFVVGPGVVINEKDLPDWQPGKYGGTVRTVATSANWQPDVFMADIENFLMAPGIGIEGIRANIVSDYKVENDNKDFTFTLRKGLKWSDGEPVTTEDIRFAYEDVMLNEKLFPQFPAKFRAGGAAEGDPMKLEIVDDFTFKISFTQPYGGFLRELAIKSWQTYTDLLKPKHYLMQFHPKYTPMDKLKPLLEESKLTDEWWNLFNLKDCTTWELTNEICAGFPALWPWLRVKGQQGVLEFERNPYYFKVDTEGKQLPYADKIIAPMVQDVEMSNLKVVAGEVDLLRENTSLVKMPMYKENEEKGGYKVTLLDMHVDPIALFVNVAVSDTVQQPILSDLRFRQAVNKALNRQEYIDNIYYGYASFPELVDSAYDPDGANKLLDEMGLDKKDADGMRMGPDGKTFTLQIFHGGWHPDFDPTMELVAEQLKKVGIKTFTKKLGGDEFSQRNTNNEIGMGIIWEVQPMWRDGTWDDYLPGSWVPMWNLWRTTNGKSGIEPPPEAKKVYDLNEARIAAVPKSDAEIKITDEIYKLHHDNLWYIPLVEMAKYPLITSSKLGNVPIGGQAIAANASLEQMFFK